MTNNIVSSTNLIFTYPSSETIVFPDLQIPYHQHTLILGNSGTGKTTLLQMIGGLSRPTNGQIEVDQQDLNKLTATQLDQFRAQHIGFIFQNAYLIKNLTLLENIKLAQSFANRKIDIEKIKSVLDHLNLSEKINRYPNELSRGQLQRAAIARSVINEPKLLIADEPTSSLDDKNTDLVLELLMRTVENYQSTLLITTHDNRIKSAFEHVYHLH